MYVIILLLFIYIPSFCYHMNIGSTGILFPYTLGALAYIKKHINPVNYTLTGISGGAWCSVLYHFEPNIDDPDMLWKLFVGDKDKKINLLRRSSMHTFQQSVVANFKERYKGFDTKDIPISIVTTRVQKGYKLKNIVIDKFEDMDDLINYCLCSSYIPFISGKSLSNLYNNEKFIDGVICTDKICLQNCINSMTWGRKYTMKERVILDYPHSQRLFKDGWDDAQKYAASYLKK